MVIIVTEGAESFVCLRKPSSIKHHVANMSRIAFFFTVTWYVPLRWQPEITCHRLQALADQHVAQLGSILLLPSSAA
jgi:hypothetical protein